MTGFLEKAVDVSVRQKKGAVRGCRSQINNVRKAVTGHVLLFVAVRIISTPV